MKHSLTTLPLNNSHTALGETFFSRVCPTPFETSPRVVHFNAAAAVLLDLCEDAQHDPRLADVFTGKERIPGSDPIAMLYAGHQFGHYVPQLGDGRAITLGETTNQRRERWEIQLKGSGLTPYSRDGDGRAVLRSTIREYLCSEAMHALGIPTTRALCIIGSDDEVYRERIEPGAMLTRLAPSHVRFGSFEVFFYREQYPHIRSLADYMLEHHFPAIADRPDRYAVWLDEVIERTASLIAHWQAVGFCHGVMNSDNMSVLGLTMDYGPYGFMEAYDPAHVCNHTDHQGRYAYDQQPRIGLFNLSCFAQAILPLLDKRPGRAAEIAQERLQGYEPSFMRHYARRMRDKLGLIEARAEDDGLVGDLLGLMAADRVDYTILFRRLCTFATAVGADNGHLRELFLHRDGFDAWAARYRQRLLLHSEDAAPRAARMTRVNPNYVLRNYMAEMAIRKAEDDRDYSEIDRLMSLLQSPYDEHPALAHYADHPPTWASGIAVSCSS